MSDFYFPPDVLSRWASYKCLDTPNNFFHYFQSSILRLDSGWSTSLIVKDTVFDYGGVTQWMYYMSFKCRGRELIEYGNGTTKSWARDTCAFRLFLLLEREFPDYLLPPYLVGFPNIRGHCYLISAVLPLLHSYPFVWRLMESFGKVSRGSNNGGIKRKPSRRGVTESAYYWTRTLYKLYVQYHKVSSTTQLLQTNVPIMAKRYEVAPVVFPRYDPNYQFDLDLDHALINGVCASLRDFCANFYATPGGFEEEAYSDILHKLASEDNNWVNEFFLKFSGYTACSRCTSGPVLKKFMIPVIRLPVDVSFQDGLDDLKFLFSQQSLICNNQISEYTCQGIIRRIDNVKVINFPRMIAFVVSPNQKERYAIPDQVTLNNGDRAVDYVRFANSNCFSCWKVKLGDQWKSYGDLYHVPVEGDELTGYHTYTTMETTEGLFECNNGRLYTPDTRLLCNVTAGSLHCYQQEGYKNFLPKINMNEVYINPEF